MANVIGGRGEDIVYPITVIGVPLIVMLLCGTTAFLAYKRLGGFAWAYESGRMRPRGARVFTLERVRQDPQDTGRIRVVEHVVGNSQDIDAGRASDPQSREIILNGGKELGTSLRGDANNGHAKTGAGMGMGLTPEEAEAAEEDEGEEAPEHFDDGLGQNAIIGEGGREIFVKGGVPLHEVDPDYVPSCLDGLLYDIRNLSPPLAILFCFVISPCIGCDFLFGKCIIRCRRCCKARAAAAAEAATRSIASAKARAQAAEDKRMRELHGEDKLGQQPVADGSSGSTTREGGDAGFSTDGVLARSVVAESGTNMKAYASPESRARLGKQPSRGAMSMSADDDGMGGLVGLSTVTTEAQLQSAGASVTLRRGGGVAEDAMGIPGGAASQGGAAIAFSPLSRASSSRVLRQVPSARSIGGDAAGPPGTSPPTSPNSPGSPSSVTAIDFGTGLETEEEPGPLVSAHGVTVRRQGRRTNYASTARIAGPSGPPGASVASPGRGLSSRTVAVPTEGSIAGSIGSDPGSVSRRALTVATVTEDMGEVGDPSLHYGTQGTRAQGHGTSSVRSVVSEPGSVGIPSGAGSVATSVRGIVTDHPQGVNEPALTLPGSTDRGTMPFMATAAPNGSS